MIYSEFGRYPIEIEVRVISYLSKIIMGKEME
jgi:hypothetical protein